MLNCCYNVCSLESKQLRYVFLFVFFCNKMLKASGFNGDDE